MIRKVWPLTATTVSLGINAYVIAAILPQIAGSLHTTTATIGLGVTVFTASYAVAGPFFAGRIASQWPRQGLLWTLTLFNVATVVTALAMDTTMFLIGRALAGAAAGLLTPIAASAAAGLVDEQQRGKAMTAVTFGLSIGTVIGVPIGMLIGEHVGWRWSIALIAAVGTVSLTAIVPSMGWVRAAGRRERTIIGFPFWAAQPVLGVIVSFGLGVTSLGLYTYLLPIASARGFSSMSFALIWAWGIGGVVATAIIGRPIDSVGSRVVLPVLVAGLLAAFVTLAFSSNLITWIVAVAVWGASGWATVPTLQDAMTRSRPERTAAIVSFQMAAMYLGSAAGSALGSAVLGSGLQPGALPRGAVAIGAGVLLLTVIVALLSPRLAQGTRTPPE